MNDESFIKLELPDKYSPSDWQEEDLTHLTSQDYSANWSEMGCRKTTTGLWLMDRRVKQLTGIVPIVLIVTSKSGKGTYFDAIPKSVEGYQVYDIDSTGADEVQFVGKEMFRFSLKPAEFFNKVSKSEQPVILLSHYHIFMNKCKMLPFLKKLGFAFILLDESHRIKEKDNQWTRNLKSLTCYTGWKHIMTGTGFINRPDEIWSPLNFLDPQTFSSYWAFRRLFCDEYEDANGNIHIHGIKPEMLEEFRSMRKKLGPRRKLEETNPEIDRPVFTPLHVELNATQRRMYNEIKQQLQAMDQQGMALVAPNVLAMLSRLRQICVATPRVVSEHYDEIQERMVQEIVLEEPSSKLDMLMEFLDSLEWDDESKNQVVVFSNFKGPLELLQTRLEKAEIPFLWMKESHSDVQRYEMWHDTWPKKEHRVFMCTLQLGSESINLASAKYCVFLDRSWSPKDNNQGVSRIYRPGQKEAAQIIHINALKTTDQRIERTNEIKQGWFQQVFGELEDGPIDIEDQFQALLNPVPEEIKELDFDPTSFETLEDANFKELLKEETAKEQIEEVEIPKRFYEYNEKIVCEDCMQTDLRLTRDGEYKDEEAVYPEMMSQAATPTKCSRCGIQSDDWVDEKPSTILRIDRIKTFPKVVEKGQVIESNGVRKLVL